MILNRLGIKNRIAKKIIPYFPDHNIYVEPFFGAGGMFFNKKKAKYNYLNDIDSDVFNVFNVVMHHLDEFVETVKLMPFHNDLLKHWAKNKETDKVLKAARFIFLSNYTLYGTGAAMRFCASDSKKEIINNIWKVNDLLGDAQFHNTDFRKFFKSFSFTKNDLLKTFIYNDPPYIGTTDNYSDSFTEKDSIDLFDSLENLHCKWAMSEFDSEFILDQADKRNLEIIRIGNRTNIKNKRTEILIINYKRPTGFFNYNEQK